MSRAALEVARREVADNVATWKVPLTFALTGLLLVTGVLSLAAVFESGRETYQLVQDEYAAGGLEGSAQALAHRFLASPNALALVVGGPAEVARAALASPPSVSNDSATLREAPLHLRFAPMDLGNVGVGVLSLVAILLSYDAIAGEKERGTLKVLLVNPLSRRDVLLGKYLGAMVSLLVPLAAALLLAFVALRATGIRFSPTDYARLLLILLFLALLVSAFVLLGLAVSSLTHRTPVAILALVLVWVMLVAGAGSVATFGATVDGDARGLDQVIAELRLLHEDYDEQERALRSAVTVLEAKNETQGGTLSREDGERLKGLRQELVLLEARRLEDQRALVANYYQGLDADFARAERYASLSPAESFRSIAQGLARTDHDSLRVRLDEFSLYLREVKTLQAEREAAGETDAPVPAFRHAPVSVGADLARVSPFIAALALQNALLFVGAALAFRRYDVR